jgi:hypothetical protein
MKRRAALLMLCAALASAARATSEPPPAKSKYLVTTAAAFAMVPHQGVFYGMRCELRSPLADPLYIVALFENPEDANSPLRIELVVEAGAKEFMVQSPPLKVLSNNTRYRVELVLYADAALLHRLGTHDQDVLFSVPPQFEAQIEERYGIRIR